MYLYSLFAFNTSVDVALFTSLRTESRHRYCLLHNPSSVDSYGCIQSHTLTFVAMKGALLCERNYQLKAFSS